MKEFAERLKQLRSEKGLSLDMVVYDLDKNDPSIRFAAYLAQYYGVSVDYLIGLTDNRTPADLLAHRRKSN